MDVGVYAPEFGMPENVIFLNASIWKPEAELAARSCFEICGRVMIKQLLKLER